MLTHPPPLRATRVPAGRGAAWLAALAVALSLLSVASVSTLWDRDEPRFAQATVEMIRSGDYLVPSFNGGLRPDKPILIYWLMALPVQALGAREVAVRLWSPIGMAVAFLLTWDVGRLLFSARAGLVAGVVLAATPLVLVTGSAATTDAVLLAFITLALAPFAHALVAGWRPVHGVLIAAALGGALLTKGPVGLAVPLGSLLTAWWLGRRDSPLTRRHLAWIALAAAAGLVLFLAWAVPANRATGGELARLGLGHHVVHRSLEPLEGHGGPFFLSLLYYPLVTLFTFFPWTLFVGGALSALLGGRLGGHRGRALLVGWIVPTLLLMTLVATKLPHYLLPVWPALALSVAGVLRASLRGELDERDRRWLRRGAWWTGPAGLATAAALIAAPWLLPVSGSRLPFFATGLLVAGTTVLALSAHRAERFRESFAILLAGTLLAGVFLVAGVVPALERLKVSAPLAAAIRAHTPDGVPVVTHRYGEPSLVFYLGRWPVRSLGTLDEAASWARQPGPGIVVLPVSEWDRLAGRRLPLHPLASARGYNFTKGRPVDLVALERTGEDRAPPGGRRTPPGVGARRPLRVPRRRPKRSGVVAEALPVLPDRLPDGERRDDQGRRHKQYVAQGDGEQDRQDDVHGTSSRRPPQRGAGAAGST